MKDKGFYRLAGEISGLRTTLASCDKDYERYPHVVGRQRARKNKLLEWNGPWVIVKEIQMLYVHMYV